jgi:cephalosporin hydroxylase
MSYQQILKRSFVPLARWSYSRRQTRFDDQLTFSEAVGHYPDRNELYAYMHHFYLYHAPAELRRHREFFSRERRGFGEDALHAMWWLLLNEHRPKECLEIGVYRGQVISLWALIARLAGFACNVHGVSPFSAVNDDVSRYDGTIDYLRDVNQFFDHFGLARPTLVRALSTDESAVEFISSRRWDLIYIDGGHDFDTVLADYRLCSATLADGGLMVMDDSSLYSDYRAPLFAFAGHPGPSRVCRDYASNELTFLGSVGHNNVFTKRAS